MCGSAVLGNAVHGGPMSNLGPAGRRRGALRHTARLCVARMLTSRKQPTACIWCTCAGQPGGVRRVTYRQQAQKYDNRQLHVAPACRMAACEGRARAFGAGAVRIKEHRRQRARGAARIKTTGQNTLVTDWFGRNSACCKLGRLVGNQKSMDARAAAIASFLPPLSFWLRKRVAVTPATACAIPTAMSAHALILQ